MAALREVFQDIVPALCLLTGISFPLSMSLKETLPLLLKSNLSLETKAFYALQILNQVTPLLEGFPTITGYVKIGFSGNKSPRGCGCRQFN